MTAHVPPVARASTPPLTLETWNGAAWTQIATATIDNTDNLSSYTATFDIDPWNDTVDTPYRVGIVVDGDTYYWNGTVRKNPVDKNEIVVINTSCQRIADGNVESDAMDWSPVKMWHPHLMAFEHIAKHDGDVLLALGDQIYEGQPTPENSDTDFNRQHDYLYKWYLWLLQVREFSKDIPTISIPDDHDIFKATSGAKAASPLPAKTPEATKNPPLGCASSIERRPRTCPLPIHTTNAARTANRAGNQSLLHRHQLRRGRLRRARGPQVQDR